MSQFRESPGASHCFGVKEHALLTSDDSIITPPHPGNPHQQFSKQREPTKFNTHTQTYASRATEGCYLTRNSDTKFRYRDCSFWPWVHKPQRAYSISHPAGNSGERPGAVLHEWHRSSKQQNGFCWNFV